MPFNGLFGTVLVALWQRSTSMKQLFTILAVLFATLFAHAQKHVYEDLLILYIDEEYEKCIAKAERYAEKPDTRRDPLPFLYMSMSYHEMSKLEKYYTQHEYRFAERDALKYAVRFRKKDKDLAYSNNYEDFWMELNTKAMESGMNHYQMGEYGKARRIFDRMAAYMPENAGAWRLRALCQERMNMKRDAEESRKAFAKALDAIEDLERLPADQRKLMRNALIMDAEYMVEQGRKDEARELLAIGEDAFMGNAEFKALHKELN